MTITEHAINRYKKRIGRKTASRKRIIAQINSDLKKDVQFRKPSKKEGHYILVTSKYQAVCCKSRVVTITELSPSQKAKIEAMQAKEEKDLVPA